MASKNRRAPAASTVPTEKRHLLRHAGCAGVCVPNAGNGIHRAAAEHCEDLADPGDAVIQVGCIVPAADPADALYHELGQRYQEPQVPDNRRTGCLEQPRRHRFAEGALCHRQAKHQAEQPGHQGGQQVGLQQAGKTDRQRGPGRNAAALFFRRRGLGINAPESVDDNRKNSMAEYSPTDARTYTQVSR